MKSLVAAALAAVCLAAPGASARDRPLLVELFTSQACSSCPPADALLAETGARRPDVLVLDLHVTYWDRLSWKDPISLRIATERQRGYAGLFGQDGVYTPQMVVDGRRQAVGSDRAAVFAAMAAAERDAASAPAVPVRVQRQGDRLLVEAGQGSGVATLWLVGYDARHTTKVGGGENGGRTLVEANVVRSMGALAEWRGQALRLPLARPQGERAAVLLQAADGSILGIGLLPP